MRCARRPAPCSACVGDVAIVGLGFSTALGTVERGGHPRRCRPLRSARVPINRSVEPGRAPAVAISTGARRMPRSGETRRGIDAR
jgi:hypothetical protein